MNLKPKMAHSLSLRALMMLSCCANPLSAGLLFEENFETPDISGYEQGLTPPDHWVRAVEGYGSGDHGMIDKDSGEFSAPAGNDQAYAMSYSNSGITTTEGVLGPPLAASGSYEVSFDVVKNGQTAGTAYKVQLISFADGALRSDCRSTPSGSAVLASATGNAPTNGNWSTASFTYTASGSTNLGKDLAIRVIGTGSSAIIDNIRFRTIPGANPGLNRVTTTPLDNETKALTYVPLLAVFDKNIAAGSGNITLKNLSNTIDTVIPISDARVTISGTLLQIQADDLLEWGKNYAVRIDAGAIVEASPGTSSFAGIADDNTWNFTTAAGDPLLYSIAQLKSHILGTITLTAAQISDIKIALDDVAYRFAESEETIAALFDLVATYDTGTITGRKGPLWVAVSLPKRANVINDLHWTMFNVMQNIMDRIYTEENLAVHEALLNGFKFRSSSNFPGNCTTPSPTNVHTATLSASYLNTFGRKTIGDGPFTFARKPTGTYLAPGTIATVTVPASMVNSGYKIRVGAHNWDFKEKPDIKRLDRVSRTYDITSAQTKVANPLGGGIYIEVPWLANAGVVTVSITGAARSPYFSAKTFHTTTASEWETIERSNPGPWADFQTDKFMMQVPKSWISAMTGAQAVQLMVDWDKAMDAMHDLLGYDRIRGKESLYPQVDLLLKNSVFAPGYPSVNTTYSPSTNYGGYATSHLIRGPQNAPSYEFHELGHGYFFPKFDGENESNVNLLHVAVMNRAFGKSLDEGHRTSMGGNNVHRSLDNTATAWMCCFSFSPREKPMDSLEKQYQIKGHAKFVDIAKIYATEQDPDAGWKKLDAFWRGMMEDDENQIPYPSDDDALMLRLCKAVGKDIRPLFHFWGVHPKNPSALAAAIAAANPPLPPDPAIQARLEYYRDFKVPANNAAFRTFAQNWWERKPLISGAWEETDHAMQWDETPDADGGSANANVRPNGDIYVEASAADIRARVDELIDLYFPDFITPETMSFAVPPAAINATTIGMSATTATALYGPVQYYFENTTNSTNSGWVSSPTWSQTGLTTGQNYSFRVKAKDASVPPIETAWSGVLSATAEADATPPAPNPMTFASPPTAAGLDSISMAASTATDVNGVEYFFDCLTPGGNDSGWQDNPSYTDTGLVFSTEYTYQVLARDKSPAQNTTSASAPASATTLTPDTTPPSFVSLNPTDNASEVVLSANLVITFDELVYPNFGSITLKNITDTDEEVIDINDETQVAIAGDELMINPATNLLPGKTYAVRIDAAALQDASGNPFAGITDDTSWNFTTAVVPYVWTQTAGNAQDWTTGGNWQGGAIPNPGPIDTVDFSTVNIAANTTLPLGADRSAQLWKFGDTSGTQTWTVNAGNKMVLGGATPTIQVNNSTTTLSNVVDGTAGLVKSGGGTLSLANTANTYSGGTIVDAGHLTIAGNGSLGSGSLTFNASSNFTVPNGVTLNRALTLNNNAVVTFSQSNASVTISGAVTGSGGLVPSNAGSSTLKLSSLSNTFTGPVTLGSGIQPSTIELNSFADSSSPGSGKIYLGSQTGYGAGTFRWGSGATSALALSNRQFVLGSGSGGYFGAIENANTDAANTVTINSNLIVGAGNGTARQLRLTGANTGNNAFAGSIGDGVDTLAGVIVNLTKAGAGTWIVSGNNTYTGKTTIEQGTLTVSSLNSVSGGTSSSNLGAPATVSNGTIDIGATGSGNAATLRYTGSGETTDRGFNLVGRTGGLTITHAGSGLLKFTGALSFPGVASQDNRKTITLSGSTAGTGELTGSISNSLVGTSGQLATSLTKSGTGTWTVTGTNTYTGLTTISAGKLFIKGDQSTANGAVSVAANATLGGTGTIGGAVTIAAGGKLEFNLSTNATSHDKLELTAGKALIFSGASTLTITSSGGASPEDYTLVTAPGGFGSSVPPATVVLPEGWLADAPRFVGTNLMLNVTSTGVATDPYETWAGVGNGFETDANGDGVDNGLAWLLGASGPSENALNKLPVASRNGNDLVLTFTCLKAANRGGAALKLQYSKDLGLADPWISHEVTVPDTAATVGVVNFIIPSVNPDPKLVNLQATIPASEAGSSGKVFARLKGEATTP